MGGRAERIKAKGAALRPPFVVGGRGSDEPRAFPSPSSETVLP